jgi:D-arginine dehydrogenase
MTEQAAFDVIIVGGGIAGASLAYFLTERGVTDVLLLEREAQPGYHATGRSAAVVVEWDPIPVLQELKVQGARFLRQPPPGFCEHPLLTPSGILVTFKEPAWDAVRQFVPALAAEGTRVETLSPGQVLARVPALAPEHFDGGVLFPDDGHIDVHELLWSYLRHARRRGAQCRWGAEVLGVHVENRRVQGVEVDGARLRARWVVNAAGAWAQTLGTLAGATKIALTPHRRTIITFAAPRDRDTRSWPLVTNESLRLYFGPDSGGLFASPMDEVPTEPCDAQPEQLAIAETLERLKTIAPSLAPNSIRRAWAGLRTFSPDRVLVVGEDPRLHGFFWLAGQGGCGIETSPAVGRIAADLLLDGATDRFDAGVLSPARFA